jgi:hypothetical protein
VHRAGSLLAQTLVMVKPLAVALLPQLNVLVLRLWSER